MHRGPLRAGEWVRLVDGKGRRHNFCLEPGKRFFSNKGHLEHDELIGREEGFTVTSSAGGEYLVFRPLLSEFVISMPRGAAVIYPKDAAQIVALADVFPGAHVVEAGVGSGALTCSLLRAVGPGGRVTSYERREEFAEVARRNVTQFFGADENGQSHPAWTLHLGDLAELLPGTPAERCDRIVLDMLAPWECLEVAADALCGRAGSSARTSPRPPSSPASSRRCACTAASPSRPPGSPWSATGTSRASPSAPGHSMIGHTAFLVTARRMAAGQKAPLKKRRPAPGAYGPDYTGPRPPGLPVDPAEG